MRDLPLATARLILPDIMLYLVGFRRAIRHILFFVVLVLPVYGCDSEDGTRARTTGTVDAAPGPVHALGSADAPVTIVDYSSLTCSHCAMFHIEVLPLLKKKYIDTGKVRFIYRNFPLDNVAHKAAMLAGCASEEKYFPLLDMLFARQRQWAASSDPRTELMNLGKMAGIDAKSFAACMQNTALGDTILEERIYGEKEYEIRSTPTLIIQGEKHVGAASLEALDEILAPLLKAAEGN